MTMKHLNEYLIESVKKYDFKIKVAGELTNEQEKLLKVILDKFKVCEFKKTGKTPIQSLPLDFPKIKVSEVSIYEVILEYPTTQNELFEYISAALKIPKENLVVRRSGEPTEQYQEPKEKREGALLDDPHYKESPNAKFEDFYGDKYNMNFVRELSKDLETQRKSRGEKIPTDGPAVFNTDSAQNVKSPITQAKNPRKK